MAKLGFDAAGFRRNLRSLGRGAALAGRRALDRGVREVAESIRAAAPGEALAASVRVEPTRGGPTRAEAAVVVGGDGVFPRVADVELGTSRRPAQPFIRAAADGSEAGLARDLADAFDA